MIIAKKLLFKASKLALRVFPILALLMIAVTSALADGPITKSGLYNDVYWSTFFLWIFISVVGSLLVGMGASMLDSGCGIVAGVVVFIFIGIGGAFFNSYTRGMQAQSADWDAMVIEKATYIERLLGKWVGAFRIHTPQDAAGNPAYCHYADLDYATDNVSATGCRMATEISYCAHETTTTDPETGTTTTTCDDYDYRYYPWFNYEESLVAELDVYKNGHQVYADRCAPTNWQNQKANLPFWAQPNVDFCIASNHEWDRINQAVNVDHTLLNGVIYQNTLNWVNADPESIYRGATTLVPDYKAKGLMPEILPITDSFGNIHTQDIFGATTGPKGFDWQVIQFLGTLNQDLDPAFKSTMQLAASDLATFIGPRLKANIVVNFAYDREVPNADQWISTTKAYQMDNTVWASTPFKTTLAMNIGLWNFEVSDDRTTVTSCRFETGGMQGNNEIRIFCQNLQPFPFTSEYLFGVMSGGFVLNPDGTFVMEDVDWDDRPYPIAKTEYTITGGLITDVMFGLGKDEGRSPGIPFKKVSKDDYEDKRHLISPDPPQIDRIKSAHTAGTFQYVGFIFFLLVTGVFGAASKASNSSR